MRPQHPYPRCHGCLDLNLIMSCILAIDAADEAVVDEAVVPVALAETISSWLDWSTAKR